MSEDKEIKGVPEGVTEADLSPGETREGPKPPVINNAPPPPEKKEEDVEDKDEEFADPNAQKKADDKADEGKEEDKADDKEPEVLEDYAEYDDPIAQAVVNQLKAAGLDAKTADGIFRAAVESGDLSKVNMTLLREKLGNQGADLAMLGFKDYYTRQVGGVKAIVEAVHTAVGGEENFNAIRDWAQKLEKSDPKFATTLNGLRKMLDSDPVAAELAADKLKRLYEADPKNKTLNINMEVGDTAAQKSFVPISRADYLKQYHVLHDKGDFRGISELDARRKASKAAGY